MFCFIFAKIRLFVNESNTHMEMDKTLAIYEILQICLNSKYTTGLDGPCSGPNGLLPSSS